MDAGAFDCDVLVVGAGPVGLSVATELAHRGRTATVVERNERVGVQPRAKTVNVRTMAHMRRWGLAAEVRRRSPLPPDYPRRVRFQTALFGRELCTFDDAFASTPGRDPRYPEHAEFIPQYVTEGILAEHVREHPRTGVEFGTRLEGFEQDGAGVTAELARGDDVRRVRARYLVGADGGRSAVRRRLGIEMLGETGVADFVTLILRIPDLFEHPDYEPALFHWIVDPAAPCILGPMDRGDVWYWARTVTPGADDDTGTLLAQVRASIGRDFPVELVARDEWSVDALIAERYRDGRTFLAGDACHLHSPFGGHGMNLGVGDAVDLGWKLAATLDGWGGDALLDSYGSERGAAHRLVVDAATANLGSLSDHFADPELDADGPAGDAARARARDAIAALKRAEFHSLGLVLGAGHEGSPVVAGEPGGPPAADVSADASADVSEFAPAARPGHLAPHLWLDAERSLYDAFGPGFTLLRLDGDDAPDDAEAAAEEALVAAARADGVPLEVLRVPGAEARALYGARRALVRPDQHLAWRGDRIPPPDALLPIVTGRSASGARTSDPIRHRSSVR